MERSHGKIRADVVADKLAAVGVRRFGALGAPGGRRGEGELSGGAAAGVSAVDPGAGDVGAVGLGTGPDASPAGRRTCSAPGWRGAGSGWSSPTWDRTLPTLIGCLDRAMRAFGGCPTYWLTDNERTVTDRPCRRDRGAASVDRRGRPPLRGDDRDLCPRRPRIEGRVGGDGAGRQGRSGADRGQPARRLRSLGRARRRLRGVHRAGQRPGASGHPAAAGRDARRGTAPPASAARRRRSRRRSGRPARCRGRRRSATAGSPTRFRTR